MSKQFSVVSLFSGGGGLDLGFKAAGFDIIWAIDNNPNAVASYRRNVSADIICSDINDIDPTSIPAADVVIGGPPCQSFSLAGKRQCDDKRGQLVWRYLEIIKTIAPSAFLFENVTGLLSAKSANGTKILDELLHLFSEIGYHLSWQLINAADYGVPQLRKRVIIVGLKHHKFVFPKANFNSDGSNGKQKYISVKDAIGDLPQAGSTELITDHDVPRMSELDKYIISHVKPGGNYMDIPDEVPSARIRRLKKDGGHTTCYGRMSPDKPSYTINTFFNRPNVGCNIHYSEDRLITVREAMRLQTFPDDYIIISTSKKDKNLIVGNAVPPLLAYELAKQLYKTLSENTQNHVD